MQAAREGEAAGRQAAKPTFDRLIVDHATGQSELAQHKEVFEMTLLEKCVAELLDGMEAQFPSQVPVCLRQKAELAQEITAEVMNNPNLKLLVAEAAKLVLLDRHGGEFLFDRLLNISDDIWEQAKVRFQEPQLRQALSDFDLGSFSEAELCALKEAAAAEVAAAHETPGSENLGSDGMVAAFLRQAIRKILGMPLGVSP